ncbi:MAG TPA: hypothetical protein VHX14_21520, partial [Thermoanaerobaculia bacterium]|nr:hypothetical protein [Thermoanaerobaculia bacterium]
MTSLYRKWGRVIRYENGTTIRVEEAGEATEVDGVFEARPMLCEEGAQTRVSVPNHSQRRPGAALPEESDVPQQVESFVAQTLLSVHSCLVERLIVSSGVSTHEINGVTWREESQRVHLSLVKEKLRVLIDLASFDIDAIRSAASALARAGEAREAPARIRLAPNVSAALLPSLIGEIAIEQRGGGLDGRGQAIETRAVTGDEPPNWFRPSYAIRPRRAWLNLRPLPFGTIDESAPIAVALLRPVIGTNLRVLCADGGDVFPAELNVEHIAAVSANEQVWYPYAAGSFG